MKLTVLERLTIINAVRNEGDIIFLRIRAELVHKLALTAEEVKEFEIRVDADGKARWKLDKPQEKEIDLSETECGMIADSISELNKQRKLTDAHMSLYSKFIENNQ